MAVTQAAIARKPIGRIRKVFGMILLTGGAGYIGSHVCMPLLDAGLEVQGGFNLYYPSCRRSPPSNTEAFSCSAAPGATKC
jgi:nucleoside-diphosphate-sugar epimerase